MATKIFLDSGDPAETRSALNILGKLDGQTTNPSLIAKNPEAQGKKFSKEEVYSFYQKVVKEISGLIPDGSVSIEVYADMTTPLEQILTQAREMNSWIPNAHIKLPLIKTGLSAAEILIKEEVNLNLTLCFSQQQAAAVYVATKGAKPGQVFLSPFVGRLDDKGINGLDLINNILEMYKKGDGHMQVLAASIRNLNHHLKCLDLQTDLITSPLAILKQWQENQETDSTEKTLTPMTYEEIDLNLPWKKYQLQHELTDAGIEKFCADWQGMIQ